MDGEGWLTEWLDEDVKDWWKEMAELSREGDWRTREETEFNCIYFYVTITCYNCP